MWITTLWNEGQPMLQWGVALSVTLVSAMTDLRSRTIPNVITLPALAAGLGAAVWSGGLPGVADALVAAALVSLPFLLLFVFAGGGGGDVKLMAAIGSWLGLVNGMVVLLAVALFGVLLAVVVTVARRRTAEVGNALVAMGLQLVLHGPGVIRPRDEAAPLPGSGVTVPYGVAIFLGSCTAAAGVFLWTT
jgi:prepilin peptidase CpaA